MTRIPSRIGKYTIQSKIAEGGMGAVFKGTHPTLNRTVILKKLTLKGSQQFIERFRREAQIMMEFKNDNIVSVYDHFKAGDSYYIVLEYIDGLSLGELIRKERYLPEDVALYILLYSAKALSYAHKRNVVHRDIKPANLLISSAAEIKLVDFGVAHMDDDGDSELTTDGMTIGTPSYMAPEQFKDSKGVNNRADLYSLGVMLYEMLTGKKPYPGNFSPEAIARIQKGKYENPRKHNPAISGFAVSIIKKAMKVNPDKRYKDADKIVNTLEKYFRLKDDQHVCKRLKSLIAGEPVAEEKQKISLRKKVLFILLPLVFVLLGLFSWKIGWVYEYLMAGQYGRLQLEVIASAQNKKPNEVFRRVQFFNDDDNEIPAVNFNVWFLPAQKMEPSSWRFVSMPVYLPAGNYRVKMQVEDQLHWTNLYLPSRNVQKQDNATMKGESLLIDTSPSVSLPFTMGFRIADKYTGRNLISTAKVSIAKGSAWEPWQNVELLSGKNYKIKIEQEGYYPKIFHIHVAEFQEYVKIDTALAPVAGSLSLSLPDFPCEVLLDEKKTYLSGGPEGEMVSIDKLSGQVSLQLNPAFYTLTIKYRKAEIVKDIQIVSGETLNVKLLYNEELKEFYNP